MNILFEAHKASTKGEALVAILHLWLQGIYIAIFCLCMMNSKHNSFCFHDDNMFWFSFLASFYICFL